MSKPLVIDLCCGLGGWSKGFLSEGWDAIGFDIEKHEYGEKRYPADLILKDITQLCGYDLRAVTPALIVASPPCQAYSYRAMPWKRAKALPPPDNTLFDACFRIAREAGVPIVVENVKGAQPWVGRAQAHYGSYYLWGDVEGVGGAIVRARNVPQFGETLRVKRGQNFHAFENGLGSSPSFNGGEHETRGVTKNDGGSWFNVAHNTKSGHGQNPVNGVKVPGMSFSGHGEPGYKAQGFNVTAAQRYREDVKGMAGSHGMSHPGEGKRELGGPNDPRRFNSRSDSRKAASAMIAEIPQDLAQWIARVFKQAENVHP